MYTKYDVDRIMKDADHFSYAKFVADHDGSLVICMTAETLHRCEAKELVERCCGVVGLFLLLCVCAFSNET